MDDIMGGIHPAVKQLSVNNKKTRAVFRFMLHFFDLAAKKRNDYHLCSATKDNIAMVIMPSYI